MVYISSLFILIVKYQSIVQVYHNLFIHSPFGGHLGHFQFLAIMTMTAMNIFVYIFPKTCALISLGYISRSEISGA